MAALLALGAAHTAAQDHAYIALHNAAQVAVVDVDRGAIVARIPVGPLPRSTIASGDGSAVFVINQGNATVSVIDTASNKVVETIDLTAMLAANSADGKGDRLAIGPLSQLAPSPDGKRLYVTCNTLGGVVEIDRMARTARATDPETSPTDCLIAISADGTRLFVVNSTAGGLSFFDAKSLRLIGTLPGLTLPPFAVSRQDDFAIATSVGGVHVARFQDFVMRTLPVRNAPFGTGTGLSWNKSADFFPDGKRFFATGVLRPLNGEGRHHALSVDVASGNLVASPPIGKDPPSGIATTADGRKLVVAIPAASIVKIYDAVTLAELASIPAGPTPMAYRDFVVGRRGGVPATPSLVGRSLRPESAAAPAPRREAPGPDAAVTHRAYIALNNAGAVAVVDLDTGTILGRIPVGRQPRATVASADGTTVLAINDADGTISVIDAAQNKVAETVKVAEVMDPKSVDAGAWDELGYAIPSPDGSTIYLAGPHAGIAEFNRRTRAARYLGVAGLGGPSVGVTDGQLAVSKDGAKLLFAEMPLKGLTIIDTRTFAITGTLSGPGLRGVPFTLSHDGKFAVVAEFSGVIGIGSLDNFTTRTVPFRNAPNSTAITTYRLGLDPIAIAPDGRRLYLARQVGAGSATQFRIFATDLATGATVTSASMGDAPPSGIALTGDGRLLVATIPGLSLVKVYDAATLREIRSIAVGPTPMAYRDFVLGPRPGRASLAPKLGEPGATGDAPSRAAGPKSEPPAGETVTVLGHVFPVIRIDRPRSALTWEKARELLPPSLLQPHEPVGERGDVLRLVDDLLRQRQSQYGAALKQLVDQEVRGGTRKNREQIEQELAEKFAANQGASISLVTQLLYNQYAALLYLSEMLKAGERSAKPPR